jgi:hypothetical protein
VASCALGSSWWTWRPHLGHPMRSIRAIPSFGGATKESDLGPGTLGVAPASRFVDLESHHGEMRVEAATLGIS